MNGDGMSQIEIVRDEGRYHWELVAHVEWCWPELILHTGPVRGSPEECMRDVTEFSRAFVMAGVIVRDFGEEMNEEVTRTQRKKLQARLRMLESRIDEDSSVSVTLREAEMDCLRSVIAELYEGLEEKS